MQVPVMHKTFIILWYIGGTSFFDFQYYAVSKIEYSNESQYIQTKYMSY